jgi:prevent-host-death family protein
MRIAIIDVGARAAYLARTLARSKPVQLGVFDARNRFSELVEAAERGEVTVITRRGLPVAKMVPAVDGESALARRRQALAELQTMNAALIAKEGRSLSWDELKQDRDQGRR